MDNCEHIYICGSVRLQTQSTSMEVVSVNSQITELRRKVALCFKLDLGASLQQIELETVIN